MNTLKPLLPDGQTVPAGWSFPARAADWQRLCVSDRAWCAVFKAVFHHQTGINLDELEHILFPAAPEKSFGLQLLTNLFVATKLTLFYVLLVLLAVGISLGGYLGFLNLRFKLMRNQKPVGRAWSTSSGSKGRPKANYHRLQSVKVDKVSD